MVTFSSWYFWDAFIWMTLLPRITFWLGDNEPWGKIYRLFTLFQKQCHKFQTKLKFTLRAACTYWVFKSLPAVLKKTLISFKNKNKKIPPCFCIE